MLKPGIRLNVFAIKRLADEGTIWTRAGYAWINRDGSMNLRLDVLPLQGELHVREPNAEDLKKDPSSAVTQRVSPDNSNSPPLAAADASASMGGH
jgi:hypothetical protein